MRDAGCDFFDAACVVGIVEAYLCLRIRDLMISLVLHIGSWNEDGLTSLCTYSVRGVEVQHGYCTFEVSVLNSLQRSDQTSSECVHMIPLLTI